MAIYFCAKEFHDGEWVPATVWIKRTSHIEGFRHVSYACCESHIHEAIEHVMKGTDGKRITGSVTLRVAYLSPDDEA